MRGIKNFWKVCKLNRILLFGCFILFYIDTDAQETYIYGSVTDSKLRPIPFVSISNMKGKGTISDSEGKYKFKITPNKRYVIAFSHQSYKLYKSDTIYVEKGKSYELNTQLEIDEKQIGEVEIKDNKKSTLTERNQVSITRVDPKMIKSLPSVFGDFSKVVATLPGVSTKDELSTTYSVRGGNFDENLVYVNGIEIYRPFLTRTGQQEGLSFVNPDLVSEIEFSAGGFQAKYGDKMSSVLDIKYKEPSKFGGSVSAGLLGGSIHFEDVSKSKKVNYVVGLRQKSAQYILGSLETKGEYQPTFTDIQSFINFNLKSDTIRNEDNSIDFVKSSSLGLLLSYARNKYQVIPSARETSFGTVQRVIRLFVAFDGQEIDEFNTVQSGLIFRKKVSRNFSYTITPSLMKSLESETFDIEGGYRLCDVNSSFGQNTFNECVYTRGIGSFFNHSRNYLDATVINLDHKGVYTNGKNEWTYGARLSQEIIEDKLSEWSFVDSSDYIQFHDYLDTKIDLSSNRVSGFIQNSIALDTFNTFTYGLRSSYWDVNKEITLSPRLQYSFRPDWRKQDSSRRDIVFRTSIGYYHQPPFYRELRDKNGVLNKDLKAQSSIHFVFGADTRFMMWGRPFKIYAETYYKYMKNIIPYDIDNVRIRYFAKNNADAYAAGFDFRVHGEFVRGVESWFSLGLLQTQEDLHDDYFEETITDGNGVVVIKKNEIGYIRRPTDQFLTAAIYFQDHIPGNRTIKMYLNLIFGTGLPFGPPGSARFRSTFSSPAYKRVDIGFSKLLTFNEDFKRNSKYFKTIWLSLEVLNLLQVSNVASYLWIEDVAGTKFAIPNHLTDRIVNGRIVVKF